MRVAYLILAHRQPQHLARLISTLNVKGSHFFVHVDRKVNDREFKAAVPEANNIVFLEGSKRLKYYWAGFSSTRTIVNLIQIAFDSPVNFDRFCLLSVQDYPIKTNSEIVDRFKSDIEFYRVQEALDYENPNPHLDFINRYHLMDIHLLNPTTTTIRYVPGLINRAVGLIPRRRFAQMKLYRGSSWWALTRECIEYILDSIKKHEDFMRFQLFNFGADEIVFGTLIKNSPFIDRVTHDFERALSKHEWNKLREFGSHYIDWISTNGATPRVLDVTDLDSLKASQSLFARKFDEVKSAPLISKIEAEIL